MAGVTRAAPPGLNGPLVLNPTGRTGSKGQTDRREVVAERRVVGGKGSAEEEENPPEDGGGRAAAVGRGLC